MTADAGSGDFGSGEITDLEVDRALLARASTAERVADVLRTRIAEGYFKPGVRLPEDAIRGALGVSRNTLREAFRLLGHEGLLTHELNRGVFVRMITVEDLEDIYRVRRLVECGAVSPIRTRPDLGTLEEAVRAGRAAMRKRTWQELGTSNIRFHQGIAALAGSLRIDELMRGLLAELRLVFHVVENPSVLHEPYLQRNIEILDVLERGDGKQAGRMLGTYLDDAQDQLMQAYAERLEKGRP